MSELHQMFKWLICQLIGGVMSCCNKILITVLKNLIQHFLFKVSIYVHKELTLYCDFMMKTFAMRNEARVEERRVETSNSFNDSVESIINWQLAAWLATFAVTIRCHSRGLKIDSLIRFDWWLTGFNYAKLCNEIIALHLSIFICKYVNCGYLALHDACFSSIILIPGHHCVGIVWH